MKRKNGFTLIELLAVIVILAVIALIATPLIMNTINDARDSAMQRSVQNIQHAAEQHLMSKKVLDENYTFTMSDFNYKGEKYDKMNIDFNDKDEAGVSVYKDNKCFYVLPGSSNVVIDKELDEAGCLAKAGEVVETPDDEVVITGDPLIPALVAQTTTSTTTTEGFIDNGDGTYTYTGASGTGGTNWLWYGGHLWRIMTVNSNDNTMELITSYPVTSISWGSYISNNCIVNGTCASLETSYVGKWLNEVFLTSLPTNVQNSLVPMTYTRGVYNGSSVVSEEVSNVKVRLLNETEYTNYSGADKYLDIKDTYLLADIYMDTFVRGVSSSGVLNFYSPGGAYGVRSAVKVSGITFTEGEGTLTRPYIASTSNAKKTTDIAVGEYVSIPTTDANNPAYLVRVISQNGGTKVALNGLYTTSAFGASDSDVTFSKSSTIYTGALTTFKGTLDTTYFDSSDKTYNITQYGEGADYSLSTTTVASDIGLLSVGEMFSGNDIDLSPLSTKTFVDSSNILNPTLNNYSWIMNSYTDSHVRRVDNGGLLNIFSPSSASGVRPVWYIKDVAVTGGTGTANDPYTLK